MEENNKKEESNLTKFGNFFFWKHSPSFCSFQLFYIKRKLKLYMYHNLVNEAKH